MWTLFFALFLSPPLYAALPLYSDEPTFSVDDIQGKLNNEDCPVPKIQDLVVHDLDGDGLNEIILIYLCGDLEYVTLTAPFDHSRKNSLLILKNLGGGQFDINHPYFGSASYTQLGDEKGGVPGGVTFFDINKDNRPDILFQLNRDDATRPFSESLDNVRSQQQILLSNEMDGFDLLDLGSSRIFATNVKLLRNDVGSVDVLYGEFRSAEDQFNPPYALRWQAESKTFSDVSEIYAEKPILSVLLRNSYSKYFFNLSPRLSISNDEASLDEVFFVEQYEAEHGISFHLINIGGDAEKIAEIFNSEIFPAIPCPETDGFFMRHCYKVSESISIFQDLRWVDPTFWEPIPNGELISFIRAETWVIKDGSKVDYAKTYTKDDFEIFDLYREFKVSRDRIDVLRSPFNDTFDRLGYNERYGDINSDGFVDQHRYFGDADRANPYVYLNDGTGVLVATSTGHFPDLAAYSIDGTAVNLDLNTDGLMADLDSDGLGDVIKFHRGLGNGDGVPDWFGGNGETIDQAKWKHGSIQIWLGLIDSDGDGVTDSSDNAPLDPTNDSDDDGIPNNLDAFPLDASEWLDSDSDGIGNNTDADDDNDGTNDPDDTFPLDVSEQTDSDGDGVGNNADTDDDNDGVSDTQEVIDGTNPLVADTDGDGLTDGQEANYGTNPLLKDSDSDGFSDYEEIIEGTDPLDANSAPRGGLNLMLIKAAIDKKKNQN